ncbi:unnamed protein product [Chondrus crispus]|uniref:Uncharacterized protein n=1 Tax=Chondrus crispus TaxID=2769 RepID=R7QBR1_CHOCR|nr:unnamed protein product [Chondrus crispus]CDF35228.1 unnamed protein product [Chondrus crispus]|eukprot:XP_005715047.1 unnamed protein product [Chondrus crispus]
MALEACLDKHGVWCAKERNGTSSKCGYDSGMRELFVEQKLGVSGRQATNSQVASCGGIAQAARALEGNLRKKLAEGIKH